MVDFIAEILKENDLFKESEIILPKNRKRKIRRYPKNEEVKLKYVERKIEIGSLSDLLVKSTNKKGQIVFKLN